MTVSKLIEKLEEMNPDAIIKIGNRYGKTPIFVVNLAQDNNVVWIETTDDFDLRAELLDTLRIAREYPEMRDQIYDHVISLGITSEELQAAFPEYADDVTHYLFTTREYQLDDDPGYQKLILGRGLREKTK